MFVQLRTAALRLIVRSWLDVPTFATRRLHACHHARAPSGGTWNCGREMSGTFAEMTTYTPFRNLLHAVKLPTWDRRLYFPSEGRRAKDFFHPKNTKVSAGCEPANLGTKGQQATYRPPKPLSQEIVFCEVISLARNDASTSQVSHPISVYSSPHPPDF